MAGARPRPPTHPVVLLADRLLDVDARARGAGRRGGGGRADPRRLAGVVPRRRRGDRARRRHPAAGSHGHGAQLPHGRGGLDDDERGPGRSGDGCCAIPARRRTLLAGFTTVRNLGLFVQTGGLLLDVTLMRAIDAGWFPGRASSPPGTPSRPAAATSTPRCSRPGAGGDAAHRRGGHRRRGQPGASGGVVPDQVRRQAHQGARRVASCRSRARQAHSTTPTRSRDRRRGTPPATCGSRTPRTATRASALR